MCHASCCAPGFPCATYNDYGRAIFSEIQALVGITRRAYQSSVCKLEPIGHAGGSGVTMLITHDRKYIVKQITRAEKQKLVAMLEDYYLHIKKSTKTGSLICSILGLFACALWGPRWGPIGSRGGPLLSGGDPLPR